MAASSRSWSIVHLDCWLYWVIQVQCSPFSQRRTVEECQAVFCLWQDRILTCFRQKLQYISVMKYSSLDLVGDCISGVIFVDRGLIVTSCLWCVLGFRSQKVQEYLRLCCKGVSEWRSCSVSRKLTLFSNLIIQFLLLAIHCYAYMLHVCSTVIITYLAEILHANYSTAKFH